MSSRIPLANMVINVDEFEDYFDDVNLVHIVKKILVRTRTILQ